MLSKMEKRKKKKRTKNNAVFHHITVRAKFGFENDNTCCLRWWCEKALVQQTLFPFYVISLDTDLDPGHQLGQSLGRRLRICKAST